MADNSGIYSPGDRNRDGMDDDIDRRPGNENDSPSYARRYDPRSEQEFSNLPEPQNVLQERQIAERRARNAQARKAMVAAQKDVHFFPDVGKFIIPAENTWAAHAELVLDNEQRLHFNPDKYFFDKIIAEKLNIPALTDKNHPDFDKYRGLRTNLEVLRNDIIGQYLDDGGFDKGDEAYIPHMQGIAEVLGDALANDVWWKRPFVNHFSQDVANVEAVGAAEMYKFLLRQQDSNQSLQLFTSGIRSALGLPEKNWGLLPLERTPFSPQGLSAPPPNIGQAAVAPAAELSAELAEHRAVESLSLITVANNQTKPVAEISEDDKKLSVEDGRTILRWLRNLQGLDMDVQDFLSTGTPPEQQAKAEALSTLVRLYAAQMHASPQLHADPLVKNGSDAVGGAAMMIAEHAMTLLPEGSAPYSLLASAIDSMPEVHFERSSQSVARLLDHMEFGLTKLTGKSVGERTALDRLVDASERLYGHAKQLRSIDTLTTPRREESVELGREILRKLRGMSFSDKPMAEMMEAGKPEDKAALAEKLDELVEIYRNLLADAVAANPGLAEDARIKAANDAVGGMTHGIKLMASKDIPNSIAQAQQISADVTQMPAEWKHMHDRTIDRLLDTMEGGLEAAVESMEQQEQDEAKDAELAQEVIETSLLHSDNGRRKRRRKRNQKSGVTKSQKVNRDIMADDRAAGQGRFSEQRQSTDRTPSTSPYSGLNANDMEAIKSLGNALRGVGNEVKSLPLTDVSGAVPVSPDDKTAAERAIEQALQARRNNNRRTT